MLGSKRHDAVRQMAQNPIPKPGPEIQAILYDHDHLEEC